MPHRSRGSRNRLHISGIDLPEVVPDQGIEVRPAERASTIPPQAAYHRDSKLSPQVSARASASGLEAVDPTEHDDTELTPDTTSHTGFFPSDKPSRRYAGDSWWTQKRRRWAVGISFVVVLFLAVIATGAATLKATHQGHAPATSSSSSSSSSATSTKPSTSTTAPSPTVAAPCSTYTGPPLDSLPSSITLPGQSAKPTQPPDTAAATLLFNSELPYPALATPGSVPTVDTTPSQIFNSIPQGLAYALNIGVGAVTLGDLTPVATTDKNCYVGTRLVAWIPSVQGPDLQVQAQQPTSNLWHNPNGNTYQLFQKVSNITVG